MAYPWEEKLPRLWMISFAAASLTGIASALLFGLSILFLATLALVTAAMVALSYLLVRRFQISNNLGQDFLAGEKESIEQVQVLMLMLTPAQAILWYLPIALTRGNIIIMIISLIPAALLSPLLARFIAALWERFILDSSEEDIFEEEDEEGPVKPTF